MACANHVHALPLPTHSPRTGWLRAIFLTLIDVWEWRHECQAMRNLDARQLDDIGVTRDEVERQAGEWLARWLARRNEGA